MSSITINGVTYVGNNVVVSNGKVIIDGNDLTPDFKEITISVIGDINELKVDNCHKLKVTGNVGNIVTKSGDVDVSGDVDGSVKTMSGDVKCGIINGSVSTMSGDIKNKK